jgi:molecular chaperone DnaJ
MAGKRDYYEILGAQRGASDDELKKAYRKLAIQFHPDRNPGDKAAEEKFKELNEAYQILSDPQKRSAYDRFGHAGVGGGGFGGFDPNGFSGSFTDIFDNIFGDIFGGAQGGSAGAAGGVDLRYHMEISFVEAAFGCEKEITFDKESACDTCQGSGSKPGSRPNTCPTCQGAGQVRLSQGFFTLTRTCPRCAGRGAIITDPCGTCRGAGRVKKPHSVSVKIPAGIDKDQRIRLRGQGEAAEPGGRTGDLYVIVDVTPHALFTRENEHVILELPITFVQAAVGADVEVPTLEGTTTLKIAPGTQSGTVKRLKGKGIKRLNGTGFGDQLVQIVVETPTQLTSKQRDLLRQFEKEGTRESQPGITSFLKKFKELFND